MRTAWLIMSAIGLLGSPLSAEQKTRICGKYSSIQLAPGETAEANGAGPYSLSLLISGPRGNWIFFDSISEPSSSDKNGTLVPTGPERTTYRRDHDRRIYAIFPSQPELIEGKIVKAGVMGVDMMRNALESPAIVGDESDTEVIKRVFPGVTSDCSLKFVPGKGLIPTDSE